MLAPRKDSIHASSQSFTVDLACILPTAYCISASSIVRASASKQKTCFQTQHENTFGYQDGGGIFIIFNNCAMIVDVPSPSALVNGRNVSCRLYSQQG
jgi:nitrite reductase/ring-hydroxylating ferredoxin subunit